MHFEPYILLYIPVFLFAITVHEFAHAWSAKLAGDLTAAYSGRLTLNPLAHIDPVGTVILPLAAIFLGIPMIGWAKPVPVNELRFRRDIWIVWVSLAGPISNILLALCGAIALKFILLPLAPTGHVPEVLISLAVIFVTLNVVLAVFNMLPIPPLDGSSLVYHFLIRRFPQLWQVWMTLTRFGFLILWLLLVAIPPFQSFLGTAFSLPARILLRWAGLM
jgi:Zn-dependent protease